MLSYQKRNEAVSLSDAAIKFISYAESVGAIREDSPFLKDSLVSLFTPKDNSELEQFNQAVTNSLSDETSAKETDNG